MCDYYYSKESYGKDSVRLISGNLLEVHIILVFILASY